MYTSPAWEIAISARAVSASRRHIFHAERPVYDRITRTEDFFLRQINERVAAGVSEGEMPELDAPIAVADYVRALGIRLLRRLRPRLIDGCDVLPRLRNAPPHLGLVSL
jgi:hypothetical protein